MPRQPRGSPLVFGHQCVRLLAPVVTARLWCQVSKSPARTKGRRRELARRARVLAGMDYCAACTTGVHDPGYSDDGVCRCRCCGRDMSDDGFPVLEVRGVAGPA